MDITLKESDDLMIGRCLTFCVDEQGKLFYVDQSQQTIIIFDSLGNQISRVGKFGNGPEEVQNVTALDVNNNNVYVLHKGGLQLSIFRMNGDFVNSFLLKTADNVFPSGSTVQVNSRSEIFVGQAIFEGDREKSFNNTSLVAVFDSVGNKLRTLGKYPEIILKNKYFDQRYINMSFFNLDIQDDLFLIASTRIPVVQHYKGSNCVAEFDITSNLFLSVLDHHSERINGKYYPSYTFRFAHFVNLGLLVTAYRTREYSNTNDRTFNSAYFISIFDYRSKKLIEEFNITDLAAGKRANIYFGADEFIYILTDDTPQKTTISKYRLAYDEKSDN